MDNPIETDLAVDLSDLLKPKPSPLAKSEGKTNRAERRASLKYIKRMTRRPESCLSMYHPLIDSLMTPHGEKKLKSRRHSAAVAKAGRKTQQRIARLTRVKRQKRSRVAHGN